HDRCTPPWRPPRPIPPGPSATAQPDAASCGSPLSASPVQVSWSSSSRPPSPVVVAALPQERLHVPGLQPAAQPHGQGPHRPLAPYTLRGLVQPGAQPPAGRHVVRVLVPQALNRPANQVRPGHLPWAGTASAHAWQLVSCPLLPAVGRSQPAPPAAHPGQGAGAGEGAAGPQRGPAPERHPPQSSHPQTPFPPAVSPRQRAPAPR